MGKDINFEEASLWLKALADPIRLAIVRELQDQTLCVNDLVEILGTTQSNISRHVKVLEQAKIVKKLFQGKSCDIALVDPGTIEKLCSVVCQQIEKNAHRHLALIKKVGNK